MKQNRILNKSVALVFAILWSTISIAQIDTTIVTSSSLHLKGNVKTLNQNAYKAEDVFGKIQQGEPCDESFAFDSYGEKLTLGYGNCKINFNKQGQRTFETDKAYGDQYSSLYEMEGYRIITSKEYIGEDFSAKTIFAYNSFGNPISLLRYDSNGNLIRKETSIYDSHQNLLKWYAYDGKGNVEDYNINTYKYNQMGKLIYKSNENKSLGSTTNLISYDTKGQVIKEIQHNSDGSVSTFLTQYNDVGQKIKVTTNCTLKKYSNVQTFTYDSLERKITEIARSQYTQKLCWKEVHDYKNDIISEDYYSIGTRRGRTLKNRLVVRYTYGNDEYTYEYGGFDNYGNWTKAIEYKNTIPTIYIERRFEYYQEGL